MSIETMLTATSLGASGRFCGSTWVPAHGTEAETPNIGRLSKPQVARPTAVNGKQTIRSRAPCRERQGALDRLGTCRLRGAWAMMDGWRRTIRWSMR